MTNSYWSPTPVNGYGYASYSPNPSPTYNYDRTYGANAGDTYYYNPSFNNTSSTPNYNSNSISPMGYASFSQYGGLNSASPLFNNLSSNTSLGTNPVLNQMLAVQKAQQSSSQLGGNVSDYLMSPTSTANILQDFGGMPMMSKYGGDWQNKLGIHSTIDSTNGGLSGIANGRDMVGSAGDSAMADIYGKNWVNNLGIDSAKQIASDDALMASKYGSKFTNPLAGISLGDYGFGGRGGFGDVDIPKIDSTLSKTLSNKMAQNYKTTGLASSLNNSDIYNNSNNGNGINSHKTSSIWDKIGSISDVNSPLGKINQAFKSPSELLTRAGTAMTGGNPFTSMQDINKRIQNPDLLGAAMMSMGATGGLGEGGNFNKGLSTGRETSLDAIPHRLAKSPESVTSGQIDNFLSEYATPGTGRNAFTTSAVKHFLNTNPTTADKLNFMMENFVTRGK
jgi:hypothetical protein